MLVARLARELDDRFTGARVRDAGHLGDGRFAVALWSGGKTQLLAFDLFSTPPVVTIELGELPVAAEPGFVRAAGAALRGMVVRSVRSVPRERIMRVDFGFRSRFGVEDGYALVCELIPRFGNVMLLKGDVVVAAAKEFGPAENAVRTIQAGRRYEPPPSRRGTHTAVEEGIAEQPAALYVYRKNGAIVAAGFDPEPPAEGLEAERAPSLLAVFEEVRRSGARAHENDRLSKRRRALERTLRDREVRLRGELAQIDASAAKAGQRETLRAQGQAIYAALHEVDAGAREEEKARAARFFAEYKKAASAAAHLQRRKTEIEQRLREIAELQWELDRADDAHLDEVAEFIQERRPALVPKKPAQRRSRKPLVFRTERGSRIYVGRSPLENADITFRVARPNDLWFHVRDQPGAHVILQRDDSLPAPQEDVIAAASLAALHSKAKSGGKVSVDFTRRKYVRKRPAAAPGLVFYTNPQTVNVVPAWPQQAPSGFGSS